MKAQILDGKKVAADVRASIKKEVDSLKAEGKHIPGLAVVLVGENPASKVYVGQKEKKCKEVGFNSFLHKLPATTTEEELLKLIETLNNDKAVDGILVQLPLPPQIGTNKILKAIDPLKDVDGFHPVNMGNLVTGLPAVHPCTPKGIMYMLDAYNIDIEGKHAVVVGRSNIVGKPIAHLLLDRNATVTICHSRTRDLASIVRQADIVVAAVGKPHLITASMVKEGAVIVDVGMNRLEEGLVGDVDFEAVAEVASWITPVPGGVGPLTIAMLLQNTLEAGQKK
ncbi:MAG: bifunctional methylenetetrahydrofolate dehydrogenase/methenyltetrahydrofolate cyclohydrolase FolD [Aminobacterium sp.]|jgi:methylenetetrahydrofolate dehydrogenase (NADP+)/methenyltetrahydrofolate cyclohydrolase|uniref:bifunctional methylenetetrahydrofolate dehydrogenase/methenyltetrahydrofolate cyclohydrolase FolD n=1 Tax=unclassified Aminobacterium TaxID=2685012 RepID=UPI001BCB1094|nr:MULTISPECIES: bifunctional methylenetetrahydrofolate dehydrogenase/methenyltetrahydrofolate cyclohydrolase FolD [unclassified Aminobacterium]MDD2205932.1 bifunctional methylenetetrahydrofolate dehydrogenase/methenyltetrahydrofolate cyclohydrolase FolD [Aminobacterium sp.]MDD3426919.1 bifunctional methylenetetrahydrofolate dehydrogenase/methenyltetrahydrofolate cyclohydrolase FolD [Aminobacterium sp.]MDD3708515.1 bifunctional methylenetetrahydrofolate dehydrogenase/methenyltetrahydrofolate cyc